MLYVASIVLLVPKHSVGALIHRDKDCSFSGVTDNFGSLEDGCRKARLGVWA